MVIAKGCDNAACDMGRDDLGDGRMREAPTVDAELVRMSLARYCER